MELVKKSHKMSVNKIIRLKLFAAFLFSLILFILPNVAATDSRKSVKQDSDILTVDFTDYYLSVQAHNADINDLFKEITLKTGVRIITESPIDYQISINFNRKGFTRGMRLILSSLKNGNYEGNFHLGKTFTDSIYKIRKISKAEIQARKEMHQHKAEFHNLKGKELLKKGKDYQAYKKFIAALRADPDYLPSHKDLINIFQLWEDDEKLIDRIKRVINLEPDNAYNHLLLAEAYRRQYFHEKALENYSKFLDKNQKMEDVERVKEIIAWMNTKANIEYFRLISESRDLISDEQFERAKNLLNQAINFDPSRQKAYELIALVYNLQHNYQDGVKWRKKLADIAPNNTKNLLFLIRDLRILSDHEAASGYLQKAKQLSKTEYMRMLIEKEQKFLR